MSVATDLLRTWLANAEVRAPSITRVTCQRWPQVGPPPHFKPGVASYGWGIDGTVVEDPAGTAIGLRFAVDVWFSDRGQLIGPPGDNGQQFLAAQHDRDVVELSLAGDLVHVHTESLTWGGAWDADTGLADVASQQLVVTDIPPAGPDPVRATMIVAVADTGAFGWL